jgi:hypothetical protein
LPEDELGRTEIEMLNRSVATAGDPGRVH